MADGSVISLFLGVTLTMPSEPTVGNLCKITGGVYEGRLGFLLEIDELWARVELADGLLILSRTLVEGLEMSH